MASVVLKCVVCGREFQAARRDMKTCSLKCKVARRNADQRERRKARRERIRGQPFGLRPRACAMCGKEFIPTSGRQRYCSRDCRFADDSRQGRVAGGYDIKDIDAAIRNARTRPPWCSERRWRIELARRRDPERYETCQDGYTVIDH